MRAAEHVLEIDRHLARARVQALLRVAALIDEALERARRERFARELRPLEDERDEDLVEVVAAELVDPGGGEHLVPAPAHADERGVERAAAEVVDDDVVALRRERAPVPVGVLEAGGGGLVQHRHGRESRRARKASSVTNRCAAVCVRRDRDDAPERRYPRGRMPAPVLLLLALRVDLRRRGSSGFSSASRSAVRKRAAEVSSSSVTSPTLTVRPGHRPRVRQEPLERAEPAVPASSPGASRASASNPKKSSPPRSAMTDGNQS